MAKTVKSVEDYSKVIDNINKEYDKIKDSEDKNYLKGFLDCISMIEDFMYDHFFNE